MRGSSLLLVVLLLLTACAPTPTDHAAADTASRLSNAVRDGDGAAACAALAPDTRESVERSAGEPCAAAVTDAGLPPPAPVREVRVHGQWAQVVTGNDTVFLGAFGSGWRVVAAGCRSRGERPYDCVVAGD
ncbi:hypothetical protein Val02_14210 [Virgisporangium aliadipatigenens]|uniref:Lipoprotein n=1 Tax=Virgisporangium aliadipatigenens TaxID=741659 RepID=A0A8J3YIE7_9ACTN|nr:hypothetical protein [Virgisporangium aliadipatigenens]GIJ44535.1 hypothetical protein Val02_14210 [Virgisporangium aliadipatigenens]